MVQPFYGLLSAILWPAYGGAPPVQANFTGSINLQSNPVRFTGVCVCVRERERFTGKRGREGDRKSRGERSWTYLYIYI
jgi:hypothetical protein